MDYYAEIPVCRICEGQATGVHYGVQSCEGCKAFFKRGLARFHEYKCYMGGRCHISFDSRVRCKRCRFEKCVNQGMSLDAVRLGRIPKSQKRIYRSQPTTPKISPPSTMVLPFRPSVIHYQPRVGPPVNVTNFLISGERCTFDRDTPTDESQPTKNAGIRTAYRAAGSQKPKAIWMKEFLPLKLSLELQTINYNEVYRGAVPKSI
ncbi:hypothetical protein RvY_14824 [Ramazzottius varieornatus]|uniref:Nuclear receptor domain-containing protein n=1 Tax=Ramazzottius varieornatus TaxID=947166 RepID=A0A1D1VSL0_RAMVA|nr:hypothetical protein RvY_14824 [Ramazzottius varieornatus]